MEKRSGNSPRHKKPELEWVLHVLQRTEKIFGYEPLYDLTNENVEKLKSALEIPFVSYMGEEKYKTLSKKAAAMLYLVSKNHAFGNGNKRTAVILMLLLLYENKKWVGFSAKELYKLSIEVTADRSRDIDEAINSLAEIIEANLEDFNLKK